MPTHSKHRRLRSVRAVFLAIVVVVVAVLCLLCGYCVSRYKAFHRDLDCQNQLDLIDQRIRSIEGFVSYPDVYALGGDFVSVICPCCGKVYVYRPISGPERMPGRKGGVLPNRMIAWCPEACHDGCRNVLIESGVIVTVTEEEFVRSCESGFELKTRDWPFFNFDEGTAAE